MPNSELSIPKLNSTKKRGNRKEKKMPKLDEVDMRILELLEENARRSFTEMAEKLKG